ncbi:MAG: TldD/PmbA family protein [Clostridia bacterium]|nr:TldD/PmbA family protein [Clostridia bacterium]
MRSVFSEYLVSITDTVKDMVARLAETYDYASALATDSKGFAVRISNSSKSASNRTMTTERGIVFRVSRRGLYSEYAFNDLDPEKEDEAMERLEQALEDQYDLLYSAGVREYETPELDDEPLELFVEKETEILPEDCELETMVNDLVNICEKAKQMDERVVECYTSAQSTHISKMFISRNRFLRQSYVYSEGSVAVVAANEEDNKFAYKAVSGLKGPEIFRDLSSQLEPCIKMADELLSSERIVPGEYEIITDPSVTGLIAHEAFGHGVEMDMFVKERALGKYYIDKRVGSDKVTMHEGALCAENVTSYAFDDEGTLAGDVTEIENGILKTGICDALSAKRLGTVPTGNGKRENYAHKVYTRMTNTIFDSGTDSLEDMISSIKKGYLLEGCESGMEDPKHWGIQCIVSLGREIIDGKLTGKIVSPVIMTGYVPDLLGNISMVSSDREVFGSGGCGKGHKEWVKVADGGPYLKTIGRLG